MDVILGGYWACLFMDLEVTDPKTTKFFNLIGRCSKYTIESIFSLYFKGMLMEDIIKYKFYSSLKYWSKL